MDDSVSDLKRQLEAAHGAAWGLEGRRRDRDGLALGWELVHRDGGAMSYHLFLRDYDVQHGEILHAVVRRDGAEDAGG